MEENTALNIANKVRLSRRYVCLEEIFNLFDEYKKTSIYFHNLHFYSENQQSIVGGVINENTINSIYLDFVSGAFDIVMSSDLTGNYLYFSEKCAEKAYSLYMFYKMNYRITGRGIGHMMNQLKGKTYEELERPDQRRFRSHRIMINEYFVDRACFSIYEENLLKDLINEKQY